MHRRGEPGFARKKKLRNTIRLRVRGDEAAYVTIVESVHLICIIRERVRLKINLRTNSPVVIGLFEPGIFFTIQRGGTLLKCINVLDEQIIPRRPLKLQ